jgi:N-acetylglucosamine-6-sulfatase
MLTDDLTSTQGIHNVRQEKHVNERGATEVGKSLPRRQVAVRATAIALLVIGVVIDLSPSSAAPRPAVDATNSASSPATPLKPNIVVIMTDDMDSASLAAMPKTKALIADKGINFVESYVNFSLCCPSRSSLFTGLAAHNHGVLSNSANRDPGGYSTFVGNGWEEKNFGLWFQDGGYATGLVGKVLNGYGDGQDGHSATHVMPGWTVWNALPDLLGTFHYFDYGINDDGVVATYGHRERDYKTDVLARRATEFIADRAGAGGPFFLLLTPTAPHNADYPEGYLGPVPAPRHTGIFSDLPLPRPPNFNERVVVDKPGWVRALPRLDTTAIGDLTTIFRRRREALLAVDDLVEKVVSTLRSEGILDDTYIVFTSDNGYSMGEHRWGASKKVVYEESVHVPLIIRGPGIPKGEQRSQLVNNLDLVATLVDWSGVNPRTVLDGRSLQPIITDPNAHWRTAILIEGTDGDLKHTVAPYGRFVAVRTRNNGGDPRSFVYAEHESSVYGAERELYDLGSDPYELHNVAGESQYNATVSALHSVLARLAGCAGKSCWYDNPLPPATSFAVGEFTSPVYRGKVQPAFTSGQAMINAHRGED